MLLEPMVKNIDGLGHKSIGLKLYMHYFKKTKQGWHYMLIGTFQIQVMILPERTGCVALVAYPVELCECNSE